MTIVTAVNKSYVTDLVERVVWTFLQAFGAQLLASGFFSVDQITNLSDLQRAGIAGVAAVLAVIKGLVAKAVGQPDTAALAPGQDI